MVDALNRSAEAFSHWKLKMQLNNSSDEYEELIEKYVETSMIDPDFVEGCEYIVWQMPDDPKEIV